MRGLLSRRTVSLVLLLLLLSHFSRVRLCETPETAAHQAPPSLGFSRQEHWSGLPFPSPMHECEKWKWSRSVVFDSSRPHGLQPTRLLHPWDFPGKSTGVGCHCLLREMISSLSHSVVFLYFFALIAEEGFLISPCYSLEFCIQMLISFLFSFAFRFSSFHSYL